MPYILVVEDDRSLCELLEMLLAFEGYDVRCATTASQALDLAEQHQPAVILFDMRLSHGSGEDFLAAYRALPNASARLIAVSGIANLEDEAARIGAHGFLKKPFDLADLLAIVAESLPLVGETA